MFSSETFIRVRYAETDQMGYVYYGNYPTYYEVARVETMRKLGYSYQTMEEEGIMMPVIHVESIYKRAAHYDELLMVRTIIKEIPAARMTFYYEIYNDKKVLLHTGSTTLAFMRSDNRRPCRCPENFRRILESYISPAENVLNAQK